MRRSERIVKAMVWGLCVCLGGYLAARGYLHLRQSPGNTRTADTRGYLYGDRAGSVSVVYAGDIL